MSKESKRAYKNAVKKHLCDVRCVDPNDFPDQGVIQITYDIDNQELASIYFDGSVVTADNDAGNSGNPFP